MFANWNKTFEKCKSEFALEGNNIDLQQADLSQAVSFTGMKPAAFCIKGNVFKLTEQTWKSLYVITLATLYASDSHTVRFAIYEALSGHTERFPHYAKISDHMFANIGLSASSMIGNIKRVLEACEVPLDRFKIAFYPAKSGRLLSRVDDSCAKPRNVTPKKEELLLNFDETYGDIAPLYYVYFDEKREILNWDDFHKKVLREICEDYPSLTKASLLNRIIFDNPFALDSLEPLNEKYYVEGNLGQQDVICQIRTALYLCGIPFDKIKVYYCNLENEETSIKLVENTIEETSKIKSISTDIDNVELSKIAFYTEQSFHSWNDDSANSIAYTQRQDRLGDIKRVLKERFSSGFKLGNSLQLVRFKNFFEELNGYALDIGDDDLSEKIQNCGLIHDERVYVTENIIDNELKSELLNFIQDSFNSGIQRLYLAKIFEKFADGFRSTPVQDIDILQTYLQVLTEDEFPYYLYRKSIFKSPEDVKNCKPKDEIIRLLNDAHGPVSDDEIYDQLSYIPQGKIKDAFVNCSATKEILSNGDHSRFVLDSFDIAGDQLDWIDSWIDSSLDSCDFITSDMLIDTVKKQFPDIVERNELFSDIGIRNALASHLSEHFNFRDNLICKKGVDISNDELIANFCKEHETFSLKDVEDFCESLGLALQSFYFEVIYKNAFRVSDDIFIRDVPVIDVESADCAIAQFMDGKDYIPVSKIQFFAGVFPDIGHRWNAFCLESYLYRCSKDFKLIHSNFAKSTCAGIIARKFVDKDFNEILSDALSYDDWTESSAKEFLKSEGYLSRLKCSNIALLLDRAKQIRTQRNLKDVD